MFPPRRSPDALPAASDSPRSKRPTLNLDEALYIQSQASLVQQPNRAGRLRAPAPNCAQSAISVDYIDCLSNDDLAPSEARLDAGQSMGLRQSSRRHLRLIRSRSRNRVEPDEPRQTLPVARLPPDESQAPVESEASSLGLGATSLAPADSTSVLYPIAADEVRQRAHLPAGQDGALLGEAELLRYFPAGRLSVFAVTWNMNRKRLPDNLSELLLPDQLATLPDIYAVGVQESFSGQSEQVREWEVQLQSVLAPSHVLLASSALGVLHLALFVRRDLIWFCSTPEESLYNSRSMPANMINTKGAVSIAFRFFGTSFMFTNCHFPAHEHRLRDRIDEYQRIIQSVDLPKDLKSLKPRYLSNDSTARFDCVFFMGDLNFRLEQRTFDETLAIIEDIFQQPEPNFEPLTQHDELLKVMETGQAFHGFDECQIKFPPTYKFLAKTNKYDKQTRRVPSYTDRILFRSKRQRHIQCLAYDWLPRLLTSDHKPVFALFSVLVRPGQEHQRLVSSLNAGCFKRPVYLEALRRQAEEPATVKDSLLGGSLICAIC